MHTSTLLRQPFLRLASLSAILAVTLATPTMATNPTAKVVASPATTQLEFVANGNQWPQSVLFATDVPGGKLFFERNRLVQALYDVKQIEALHDKGPDNQQHRLKAHAYSVTFVGADLQATAKGEAPTGSANNYFIGNDRAKWASNVPIYNEVRYEKIYPGTSLRFYTHDSHLEYDFELAPGADARQIKLRYEGQQKLSLVNGALQITTSVGTVVEQAAIAYQLLKDRRVPVPCKYRLDSNNNLTFDFPQGYNHALPLVIDPVLVYSTYSGSAASNYGYTATFDEQGNLYAGGVVFNQGYPTTIGAYDVSYEAGQDYGIMKFNPAAAGAASRVYGTYIGGGGDDHPHSMVVDPMGNLVILGSTNSGNFPTTVGAYDPSYNSGIDIVISKLSANGQQLLASTFLGNSGLDGQTPSTLRKNYGDAYRGDITTDAEGNIYLASNSASANFPIVGGFQPTLAGNADAVVVKMNSGLSSLVWSSFLGGSNNDAAYSIQVDGAGTVFVSGGTSSTDFPGTSGGLNATYKGGVSDGFIARIAPGGNSLIRSSYVGTSGYDQAHFVQLDLQGNVYLYGQTDGDYPVSPGVYSNANSRQFIHKINRELTTSLFSTVIGNGPASALNISPTAFLVDNCGQILLAGWGGQLSTSTSITNMPTTPDALIRTVTGGGYHYIMQLSANAENLVYATYFGNGNAHVDGGTSRFDKRGVIYESMCVGTVGTGGNDFTTPNAWATAKGSGSYNNAAFKMDVLQLNATFTASNIPAGPRIRRGCAPLTVYFTRPSLTGVSSIWDFGNSLTSTSNAVQVSTVYRNPGRYVAKLTVFDPANCLQSVSSTDTIEVFGLPPAAAGPDRTICEGNSVTISVPDAGPGVTYNWFPPVGLNTTSSRTVIASPTASTYYLLTTTTPNNCNSRDTVLVNVIPRVQVSIAASTTNEFTGTPISFTATSPRTSATLSYLWNFGDGQTSTERTPAHTYTEPGNYQVRLTTRSAQGECEDVQELAVLVRKYELPNIITPNNDGKNDTFKPFVAFQPVSIRIFDRWGKQVFEQANYVEGWGKDNVPSGLYYYKIDSNTGESWKGWVEVAR
ncbi:PKD domain-containing protein [Hymenobacter sp. BT664]|uniref:PKD domain-containing protein n=1 Tax=Hymenobacter montanus TaxID=2771359 RepID=A0A927BE58_9BACT|nr:PKD domain-containing protein [Hymenobacter montanus]MBD2768434.1 PKD domain-containing protein [Hymenobacter montanus]